MARHLTARLRRFRGMFRVAAAVLLLLASADLAMPQFCEEDSAPLIVSASLAKTLGHADGSPEPQSNHASAEDCFCCCSHIVSEAPESRLGALALVSIPASTAPSDVTFAPGGYLFRPPRLA